MREIVCFRCVTLRPSKYRRRFPV